MTDNKDLFFDENYVTFDADGQGVAKKKKKAGGGAFEAFNLSTNVYKAIK